VLFISGLRTWFPCISGLYPWTLNMASNDRTLRKIFVRLPLSSRGDVELAKFNDYDVSIAVGNILSISVRLVDEPDVHKTTTYLHVSKV
jgi:hypothetical protein